MATAGVLAHLPGSKPAMVTALLALAALIALALLFVKPWESGDSTRVSVQVGTIIKLRVFGAPPAGPDCLPSLSYAVPVPNHKEPSVVNCKIRLEGPFLLFNDNDGVLELSAVRMVFLTKPGTDANTDREPDCLDLRDDLLGSTESPDDAGPSLNCLLHVRNDSAAVVSVWSMLPSYTGVDVAAPPPCWLHATFSFGINIDNDSSPVVCNLASYFFNA